VDVHERPWGWWRVLALGPTHKVKTLAVRPRRRLSYQSDAYRSEHWFVVEGTATWTIDGVVSRLGVGGAIDVPSGATHRLANDADVDLVVVEVQLGAYTGEDDIVGFDDYGRVAPAAPVRISSSVRVGVGTS
jgi:mannose-6-phosphate isomerase-like protein (cupin superfamily)